MVHRVSANVVLVGAEADGGPWVWASALSVGQGVEAGGMCVWTDQVE